MNHITWSDFCRLETRTNSWNSQTQEKAMKGMQCDIIKDLHEDWYLSLKVDLKIENWPLRAAWAPVSGHSQWLLGTDLECAGTRAEKLILDFINKGGVTVSVERWNLVIYYWYSGDLRLSPPGHWPQANQVDWLILSLYWYWYWYSPLESNLDTDLAEEGCFSDMDFLLKAD